MDANAQRGARASSSSSTSDWLMLTNGGKCSSSPGRWTLEQLAAAEVGPADTPLDAAVGDRLADPEPRPDLEGLALHADGLRADALASRLGLEEVDAGAVLGQAPGQRQADRAGTDDRDVRHRRA